MAMKNYRLKDGCWNCLFVFLFWEQDDPDTWYCNVTQDRPKCGKCDWHHHKECFIHNEKGKNIPEDESLRLMDTWNAWCVGKEVKPYGICDCWEENHGMDKKTP